MTGDRTESSLTLDLFANLPAPTRRAGFVANRRLSERGGESSEGPNFFVNTFAYVYVNILR